MQQIWCKKATNFDTSTFVKKVNLGSLKSVVDKLDVDKLKTVTIRLNNLKTDVDEFDITKLQTLPVDCMFLSWRRTSLAKWLSARLRTKWWQSLDPPANLKKNLVMWWIMMLLERQYLIPY